MPFKLRHSNRQTPLTFTFGSSKTFWHESKIAESGKHISGVVSQSFLVHSKTNTTLFTLLYAAAAVQLTNRFHKLVVEEI
jgi:hypothetical protein